MQKRAKKIVSYSIGIIGFISSVIGIWVFLYEPTPASEIELVEDTSDILIEKEGDASKLPLYMRADEIVVDGLKIRFPPGQLIVANKILLKDGAEIEGDSIFLAATQIEGGRITSNRLRDGIHGGDLFLAVAMLNGTLVEANGGRGRDGSDGVDGEDGQAGADGKKGSCKGFGGWSAAHAGLAGGNGGDGLEGEDGERGGDAGNILILTSYEPTVEPIAIGGDGGKGGHGGAAGRGGSGGRGGTGCTGLGGSQDGKPDGARGKDGKPGKDGRDGAKGRSKKPNIKIVDFWDVRDAVMDESVDREEIITALRSIRPKSS